jgi:hypothetical protein
MGYGFLRYDNNLVTVCTQFSDNVVIHVHIDKLFILCTSAIVRCATGFARVGTEAVTATCKLLTDPNGTPDWDIKGTCVKGDCATSSNVVDSPAALCSVILTSCTEGVWFME